MSGAASTGIEVLERDEVPRARNEQQRRHAAVEPEAAAFAAELGPVLAVVLHALQAASAPSATPGAVDRDRCAGVETGDAGADRLDPARVLVAEGERRVERQEARAETRA